MWLCHVCAALMESALAWLRAVREGKHDRTSSEAKTLRSCHSFQKLPLALCTTKAPQLPEAASRTTCAPKSLHFDDCYTTTAKHLGNFHLRFRQQLCTRCKIRQPPACAKIGVAFLSHSLSLSLCLSLYRLLLSLFRKCFLSLFRPGAWARFRHQWQVARGKHVCVNRRP